MLTYYKIVIVANANSPTSLLSSADNLCKQFGPRSGLTKCRPKLFGTRSDDTPEIAQFFEKDD